MSQTAPSVRRPWGRHLTTAVAMLAAGYIAWTALSPGSSAKVAHLPNPQLSPADVVRIQVSALGRSPDLGEGIAVAFRFSSPSNRARTGPISHFASMIRSDRYAPLLHNVSVQYGRTLTHGDRSYTALIVTDRLGLSSAYVWVLGRQKAGACHSCWMTDSVIPVGDMTSLRFA